MPKESRIRKRSTWRFLKPYRWQVAGIAITLLISSGAMLGFGQALRHLVDEGLGRGQPAMLDQGFVLLLLVVAMLALSTYGRVYLLSSTGERMVQDIRRRLFRHLLTLDATFYESTRTGHLTSCLMNDTSVLQTALTYTCSTAARNVLLALGGFALLLATDVRLTAWVLGLLPVVIAPILILGRKVRGMTRTMQQRIAETQAEADENLGHIRSVQALTLEPYTEQRFAKAQEAVLTAALSRIRIRALLIALVIALIFGAVLTVLWIGGHDVLAGRLSPGALSAFVFYAVLVAGAVGSLAETTGELQRAAGAADRILELLAQKPGIVSPPAAPLLPVANPAGIRFAQVNFAYPSRPQPPALQEISFSVVPGERVAVVGPSGAGKTTLFQLLLRFYDPASGTISIGEARIDTMPLETLRALIGLVPQEPAMFAASIRENILIGRPDATDAEIAAAANAAQLQRLITQLPEGYETLLGERGTRLSGGQRQRVAIARILLRNPKILLLDEATSALDAESEHEVQKALEAASQGRTTLVIAHRLATVRNADRIMVMNEGRIEATGTHAELLRTNSLYTRLAELQFIAD